MAKVMLYTKADCCLCDEVREVLARVRADVPFELDELDIAGLPALEAQYGERVPVVLVNGVPEFELGVDERELRLKVAQGPEVPA